MNDRMNYEDQDPLQSAEPVLAPCPLFVVSMWRSGSSLAYALLNKHPRVALMYEADLILLRPAFLSPKPLCDWAERWELLNEGPTRHKIPATTMAQGCSDFPTAFTVAHQLYARRYGATIWGDKSPNYYDCLNRMADDFPQARFIVVWRDPASTANAVLRAASLGNSYFGRTGAVLCGLVGYQRLKQECDRLLTRGKPVCQISYEDLVRDTPSVMREVCEFLQIPYDDSLSNLEGADRSAIYDGEHHANAKSDRIVTGPRPDLLGSSFRAKINQYVARWHQLYGAAWPPYPQPAENSAQPVHRFTRLIDLALYRMFRTRDRLSLVVFSFFPISALRRYREWKNRHRPASIAAQPDPVDSGGS